LVNQDKFKVDKSFIAVKRFNRWYLLNAMKIKERFKPNNRTYEIDINSLPELHDDALLHEEQFCFRNNESGNFHGTCGIIKPPNRADIKGIDMRSLQEEEDGKLTFRMNSSGKFIKSVEEGIKAKILLKISGVLEKNIKDILINSQRKFYSVKQIDEIPVYTDFCPTLFNICDPLISSGKIQVVRNQSPKNVVKSYVESLINSGCIANKYLDYYFGRTWVLMKGTFKKKLVRELE
jgi:hypothetical protein